MIIYRNISTLKCLGFCILTWKTKDQHYGTHSQDEHRFSHFYLNVATMLNEWIDVVLDTCCVRNTTVVETCVSCFYRQEVRTRETDRDPTISKISARRPPLLKSTPLNIFGSDHAPGKNNAGKLPSLPYQAPPQAPASAPKHRIKGTLHSPLPQGWDGRRYFYHSTPSVLVKEQVHLNSKCDEIKLCK